MRILDCVGQSQLFSTDINRSSLLWRHNGRDGVSNHQPHDYLLNRLFRRRSKKTSKLRVTGLCAGYSPVTGELPAQMASNAEFVFLWWCHHSIKRSIRKYQIAAVTGYICPSLFHHLSQWLTESPKYYFVYKKNEYNCFFFKHYPHNTIIPGRRLINN